MNARPATTVSSLLLCITSIHGLFMHGVSFSCIVLVQTWFLANAVTAGIYAAVHGSAHPPKYLWQAQEVSNWVCGGVAMPLLAAFFLLENDWTLLALPLLASTLVTPALHCSKDLLPAVDRASVVGVLAGASTVAVTVTSYASNNVAGMTGGVCLILGNVALAQSEDFGAFAPLDVFLLLSAVANYFICFSI